MTDKEIQNLIRKTQKATAAKHKDTQLQVDERRDLERQEQARKNFVDIDGEKDLLVMDAPAEDLFRMMKKRDF